MLHSSRIIRCKEKIINPVPLLCSCLDSSYFKKKHFVTSMIHGREDIKHHHYTNCITSIPIGISWIRPFFTITNKSVILCRSLSTDSTHNQDQVGDEAMNEMLLTIQHDPSSSSDICISYINKLCKDGQLLSASRFLRSLRQNNIFSNPDAYNVLLATASEMTDIDIAVHAFKELMVSTESLNSTSYLNVAKAFIKTNNNDLVLKFVVEISELNFPKNATVINRVIYAFAKCKQFDKAMFVYNQMKGFKCKPDQITFNTVLDILGRSGRIDEMILEFASMKEANVSPDVISYNTLINSSRKVGRLDLCVVFLKEMVENGFEPDLRTYTALIESFGRSGNVEESLKLFGEMNQKHVRPSIYIYRSLINNLKKMGNLELAMDISNEMDLCSSDLVGPKDFKRKK